MTRHMKDATHKEGKVTREQEQTLTFCEVLYPGAFFSEEEIFRVEKRDPKEIAKKYKGAFCFHFYDQNQKRIEIDGETRMVGGKPKNLSPKYYPGAKTFTAAELKKLDGDFDILISNMKANGWKRVVRCRTGNFQPFEDGDVIL